MGVKVGLWFLLVLGISWVCVDARRLVISDVSSAKNNRVCTLCEQYTEQALDYLRENKTQTEIIDTLHLACSHLLSYKEECVTLVDYYAPLFFLEVATVQPWDFCHKVNLCDQMVFASQNSCTICHQTVDEVLVELEDPDKQLEIIEILLKLCGVAEKNHAQKCKKLVFEYGPLILTNAEKFLQNVDLCTTIHACKSPAYDREAASSEAKLSLLSES